MTEVDGDGPDGSERQCYICLGGGAEDGGWVSPCRCIGTMAWVHRECVLLWVRELEQHGSAPSCAQCLTPFLLTPEKGPLLSYLEFFYKRVFPASKFLVGSAFVTFAFDTACTAMGVVATAQVYGVDDTVVMLTAHEDPVLAVCHMQLVTYSLAIISYLPWEDCLLRFLRRSSRLPLLSAVLPADLPERFQEPLRTQPTGRVMAEVLLLPVFAKVVGTVFFGSVESPLNRVLVGGAVFLGLRCCLSMYLGQKMLTRQQYIRVLPMEEAADTRE